MAHSPGSPLVKQFEPSSSNHTIASRSGHASGSDDTFIEHDVSSARSDGIVDRKLLHELPTIRSMHQVSVSEDNLTISSSPKRAEQGKERTQRATSLTMIHTDAAYLDKYMTLRKKYRRQSSQLHEYKNKITGIQDNAEDTEERLRKEYELQLLHLRTKLMAEEDEKSRLLQENGKLKQQVHAQNFHLQLFADSSNRSHSSQESAASAMRNYATGKSASNMQPPHSQSPVAIVLDMDKEDELDEEDEDEEDSDDEYEYEDDDDEAAAKNTTATKLKNQQNTKPNVWRKIWNLIGPSDVVCFNCSDPY